jgi:hypothetical protein
MTASEPAFRVSSPSFYLNTSNVIPALAQKTTSITIDGSSKSLASGEISIVG